MFTNPNMTAKESLHFAEINAVFVVKAMNRVLIYLFIIIVRGHVCSLEKEKILAHGHNVTFPLHFSIPSGSGALTHIRIVFKPPVQRFELWSSMWDLALDAPCLTTVLYIAQAQFFFTVTGTVVTLPNLERNW